MEEILLYSEEFKCSRCKKHLSVAPILALENDEYICGRCQHFIYEANSNPKIERQTLYEKLAENVRFPCRNQNKGCKKILEWNKVDEHEKSCKGNSDTIECIFNAKEFDETERCPWKGTNEEYFKHLEQHAETVDKIEKTEIWDNPKSQVFRIELFNNIMLVFLLFFENVQHFIVVGRNRKSSMKYTFSIEDETGENSCRFSRITSCLPLNINEILGLQLNFYPQFLTPKYFSIFFNNEFKCNDRCNADLLPICQNCKEKFQFSVYTCYNNHRHCERCAKRPNFYCGVCPRNYGAARVNENENLIIQLSRIHYKCGNAGCSYHGNLNTIHSHIAFCKAKIDKYFTLSKLDFANELKACEFFFAFDDSVFRLLSDDKDNYNFTFRASSIENTDVKYEFKITIFNSTTFMEFKFFPNFDLDNIENRQSSNSVKIPKVLLNQCREVEGLQFKMNISKI